MIIYVTSLSYVLNLTEQQVQALANAEVRLLVDTTDHAVEILLPPVSRFTTMGVKIFVVDYLGNAATNNITVTPDGSDRISGGTGVIASDNGFLKLEIADSNEWAQTGGGEAGVATTYSTSVNGVDSTTVTVVGLIGKTIISVFTDGILRNSNAGVGPVDYTFDGGTGEFTFSSTVYADQIVSIIYK